jgi:hypothetical protein
METSAEFPRHEELLALTTTQAVGANQALKNSSSVERSEHFTAEQSQSGGVLSCVSITLVTVNGIRPCKVCNVSHLKELGESLFVRSADQILFR